jgi:hypothetical protein
LLRLGKYAVAPQSCNNVEVEGGQNGDQNPNHLLLCQRKFRSIVLDDRVQESGGKSDKIVRKGNLHEKLLKE